MVPFESWIVHPWRIRHNERDRHLTIHPVVQTDTARRQWQAALMAAKIEVFLKLTMAVPRGRRE